MGNFKSELSNYQNLPRELVFDKTLSDRARFVYVFMACKPDGWDFFLEPMSKDIGYSVDTLRKYLNELVASGWLVKGEQSNEHGIFGAVEYTLKATKFTDTVNFRYGKNTAQENIDNISLPNTKDTDNKEKKEKNKIIPCQKNDYQAIVDCWNEHNGKKLGKVTKVTERRKKAIKKALEDNGITQEQLMLFFKTLPLADKWLYNPNKQHANWKSDFDWWLSNPNGWLTKGLEGKVHLENPQAYSSIMLGKDAPYTPLTDGALSWNKYYNCYMYVGYWDGKHIPDGYDDDTRPDGASVTLNNGRGTLVWSVITKTWNKV